MSKPRNVTVEGEVLAEVLSDDEAARLGELEQVIHDRITAFVEVGQALREIRDSRLYREEYASFEDYCKQAWDITRSYGYRLIDAAEVVAEMSTIVDTPLPTNESQAHALKDIEGPEAKAAAMQKASEDGPPTAAKIRAAAADVDPLLAERRRQQEERDRAKAEKAAREKAAKDEADRIMATRIAERRQHDPRVRAEHINQTVRGFLLSDAHTLLDVDPREAAESIPDGDEESALADADRLADWLETYRRHITDVATVTDLRSVK